ncbi:LOW QUALITY PROTEIN: putative EGF-like and EMI domain-containing protein 1 [Lutra lutra]|uniref:LOW QUALITY PROTEIN: putative EGF-like and EMI domain-containing protein 1 n=1 Tax=Lutra lutra TaxID=9657 RepID=UPI001FD11DF6|nr:LOW QUALITY PROTEIN: putative EGF-like and EMI domain-containing protein 1 [Lutra lutra]
MGQLRRYHSSVGENHIFRHNCSVSGEDLMNGGRCQEGRSECSCPDGCRVLYCIFNCPKGVCGAGRSSECQCMEENTLESSAKNGSCTCKSGYQGNRCQKAAAEYTILENASEIPTVKENELKPALLASGDQSGPCEHGSQRHEKNKTGSCDCPLAYTGKARTTQKCISLTNLVLSRQSSLMKYQQNVSSHREVRQRRHGSSDRPFKKLLCKCSVKLGMWLKTDGNVITNGKVERGDEQIEKLRDPIREKEDFQEEEIVTVSYAA